MSASAAQPRKVSFGIATGKYPPSSARVNEEMEKRSSQRARILVTRLASQGLSANKIGRALMSMMVRSDKPLQRKI